MLVYAFVMYGLDNCNSLLYRGLQLVQNCAVRLILCGPKYDHITP